MKKTRNLLLLTLLIILTTVSCKNEKKGDAKKAAITEATQSKPDDKKPAKKKVPKTDPLKIVEQAPAGTTAKSVIDNYFKVIGGADKAKKVKTILQKSLIKDAPDQHFESITKYMLPNKMYEETSLKGNVFSKIAFNGKVGYDEYEGERRTFTAEQAGSDYDIDGKAIFSDFDYVKGTLKGIAEVRGEKCYMIVYKNEKIYYSVATGLRVVVIETVKDDDEKEKIVVRRYTSDYRDVDGLKFPFKLRETRPNMRSAKFDVQEILVNKGVSNKDFE